VAEAAESVRRGPAIGADGRVIYRAD